MRAARCPRAMLNAWIPRKSEQAKNEKGHVGLRQGDL